MFGVALAVAQADQCGHAHGCAGLPIAGSAAGDGGGQIAGLPPSPLSTTVTIFALGLSRYDARNIAEPQSTCSMFYGIACMSS